ncbi:ABC transporter ATP-binding protein [Candidatus Methanodesulfokora washburnensis]|uniref:ABC transporter ATP-binding protein n=1 Tax=Candidatus Methanodesulfokora washburnensis TaxID=2478471 RepID=A0A3R9RTI4_9CREN|nr:ABC transporter ATP-binding protein [Candidatus Methanodesulfokores washburnensis]RSN78381.1 ABC transporter ATP-binding protein [Candidatus Methanodesulfokores washburnensis]
MLLKVEDLRVEFHTYRGTVHALNGVTFDLDKGEVLGLAGETGSGKSVTALSIQRLLPPNARIVSGKIIFDGIDLVKLSEEEMEKIRGRRMAAVFQDPHTYLNPVFKIGRQFVDILKQHDPDVINSDKKEKVAREKAIQMLKEVKMPAPERVMEMYPHELSGGMKQRVLLAMAYSLKPDLIIADEATTALDVTIQAQVLEIMKELQKKSNISIILITHDLGIIAENCNRVAVMYAGRVVEFGRVTKVLVDPKHPYTQGLIRALPRTDKEVKPISIPGTVPDLVNPPPGCPFHPRCQYAMDICKEKVPEYREIDGVRVACFLYGR